MFSIFVLSTSFIIFISTSTSYSIFSFISLPLSFYSSYVLSSSCYAPSYTYFSKPFSILFLYLEFLHYVLLVSPSSSHYSQYSSSQHWFSRPYIGSLKDFLAWNLLQLVQKVTVAISTSRVPFIKLLAPSTYRSRTLQFLRPTEIKSTLIEALRPSTSQAVPE